MHQLTTNITQNTFETLLNNYKTCFCQLEKIKNKARKVSASEKAVANRLMSTTTNAAEMKENEKLCQTLNKLKFEVDSVLQKCIQDEKQTKLAVQQFINNKIVINEPNKQTLTSLITRLFDTLVEFDQPKDERNELQQQQEEEEEKDKENALHSWILQLATLYMELATVKDQKFILEQLMRTRNISSWGLPLIQLNYNTVTDLSCADDYTHALSIILFSKKKKWTEDDYLAVLDQLDISTTFDRMISSSVNKDDNNSSRIFAFSMELQDALIKAVESSFPVYYTTLSKQLLQTIIHNVHCLLHDHGTNQLLLNKLVDKLLDIDKIPNGWFFLSTLPFKDLSVQMVWHSLCKILDITISLDQPITDASNIPIDISSFIANIRQHPTQGIFMMNCLFNIANVVAASKDESDALDPLSTYQSSTMAHNIIVVICFVFFSNAFLYNNDEDHLNQAYYKDTRESLASICTVHPFVTSFLFRFTIQHLEIMGKASFYLFHALPLSQWKIGKQDVQLLRQLFCHQPLYVQFAKYIIENLNYGYTPQENGIVSTSQPWHSRNSLFLSSEIHVELGFLLLSACHYHLQQQQQQSNQHYPNQYYEKKTRCIIEMISKEDNSDNSDNKDMSDCIAFVEKYLSSDHPPIHDSKQQQMEVIHWAWNISTKLKLYDCPVSAFASEQLEKCITPTFLKLILQRNNTIAVYGALIIYTSFLLSATSRHFLQFESMDGWLKLFTILKKGDVGIIQILSEIIPSFVYMHGDDFFNDEQDLLDFIRHLVLFKLDPLLKKQAQQDITLKKKKYKVDYIFNDCANGGGLSLVIGSHLWQARFIDQQNDDLSGNNGFSYFDLMLHSWLKTLFRQHEWMLDVAYLSLVDCVCKIGFIFNKNEKMIRQMLKEETARRVQYKQQLKQRNMNSPKITRLFKNMFMDEEGDGQDSLLAMIEKKTTFQAAKSNGQVYAWFIFSTLLMEIAQETPLRKEVAQLVKQYVENPKTPSFLDYFDITTVYHQKNNKPIESFLIYRWLKHLLNIPVGHTLTPLFLQVFFRLYFAGVSITAEKQVVYGHVFFTQKLEMKLQLRNYLLECRKYHHDLLSPPEETTSENRYSNETKDISSLYSLYNAMLNWLDNPAVLDANTDIRSLPSQYLIDRLEQCYKLEDTEDDMALWMDLINLDSLQDTFIEFPWYGSEKFTEHLLQEDQKTIASITTKHKPPSIVVLPLPQIKQS